ncbi:Octopamine receptor [Blattella germanica]|nr:Octopamine receptor [Blattella germanica]
MCEDVQSQKNCSIEIQKYNSSFGMTLMLPEWEAITTAITLTIIIIIIVVGNILVIISVLTYRPLQLPQNYFLVSLAVADLTVSVFVMPLSIVDVLLGYWKFGSFLCKMWLTCDILCCTASILHICAIALDRYWAITDPLNYAQKRTKKRVFIMIAGVWILSAIISSPPLVGWNRCPQDFGEGPTCTLTEDKGYRAYSGLGSFYIPLFIMIVVYLEIYIATRKRLKERERASKLSFTRLSQRKGPPRELESMSSETPQDEVSSINEEESLTLRQRMKSWIGWNRSSSKVDPPEESATDTDAEENVCETPQEANLDPSGENGQFSRSRNSIKKPSKKRRPSQSELMSPTSLISMILPSPMANRKKNSLQIDTRKKISLSKERRAARTLGIIMGVFVACWLPFFLMYIIVPNCATCCPSHRLVYFITWLGYANSLINPLIYTIFNMDFRKSFKKLLHIKT